MLSSTDYIADKYHTPAINRRWELGINHLASFISDIIQGEMSSEVSHLHVLVQVHGLSMNSFCGLCGHMSNVQKTCLNQFISINELSSNFNDIKYTRGQFCMTVIIVQYYATLDCQ